MSQIEPMGFARTWIPGRAGAPAPAAGAPSSWRAFPWIFSFSSFRSIPYQWKTAAIAGPLKVMLSIFLPDFMS